MKKFFISTLLVCSMLLSLGTAAYADTKHYVFSRDELEEALGSASPVTIYLKDDIDIDEIYVPSGKEVILSSDNTPRRLTCVEVFVEGKLTLQNYVDIVVTGTDCSVTVYGGTFIMEGGSVTVTDGPYAVDIASGGFFKLSEGGTVSGKSGVRVGGSGQGGIGDAVGAFEMYGGTVTGTSGNGVDNKGAFTMEAGTIEAAKVGVSNEDPGSFTMTGGSVAGGIQGLTGSGTSDISSNANIYDGQSTVPPAPPAQNDPAPNNPAPAAPVVENVYYIPATDDNSNMALWSILALALLSTAFVTRKRKSEN